MKHANTNSRPSVVYHRLFNGCLYSQGLEFCGSGYTWAVAYLETWTNSVVYHRLFNGCLYSQLRRLEKKFPVKDGDVIAEEGEEREG